MNTPTSVAQQSRPAFRIRPARRGDADALASLLAELGYPNAADQATVHWVMSHPEIEVLVAGDAQDKAVGMISFSHRPQLRLNGRLARIEELVVTESWRRRGVGRELMRHALERARSLSVKQVELVSHRGRDSFARPFYLSFGYTEIDAAVLRLELPPKGR